MPQNRVPLDALLGRGGEPQPVPPERAELTDNDAVYQANVMLVALARPMYAMRVAGELGLHDRCAAAAREILRITGGNGGKP